MTLWNMARAASRRPLPKPRKVHAPVEGNITALRRTLGSKGPTFAGILAYDMKCPDCGYHECGCGLLAQRAEEAADRDWFNQQEAQRAALAINVPAFLEGYYSVRPPPVQNHLRHGDPRRMSLGYNERDYDESRRVTLAALRREYKEIAEAHARGDEVESARICLLGVAIAEHERKLPKVHVPLEALPEEKRSAAIDLLTTGRLPGAPTYNSPWADLQKRMQGYNLSWDTLQKQQKHIQEHGHYGRNNPDSEGFFLNLEANAGKQITVGPGMQEYFEDQAKLLEKPGTE